MTAAELIEELSQVSPDTEVEINVSGSDADDYWDYDTSITFVSKGFGAIVLYS
jgi:hypothetical protein